MLFAGRRGAGALAAAAYAALLAAAGDRRRAAARQSARHLDRRHVPGIGHSDLHLVLVQPCDHRDPSRGGGRDHEPDGHGLPRRRDADSRRDAGADRPHVRARHAADGFERCGCPVGRAVAALRLAGAAGRRDNLCRQPRRCRGDGWRDLVAAVQPSARRKEPTDAHVSCRCATHSTPPPRTRTLCCRSMRATAPRWPISAPAPAPSASSWLISLMWWMGQPRKISTKDERRTTKYADWLWSFVFGLWS